MGTVLQALVHFCLELYYWSAPVASSMLAALASAAAVILAAVFGKEQLLLVCCWIAGQTVTRLAAGGPLCCPCCHFHCHASGQVVLMHSYDRQQDFQVILASIFRALAAFALDKPPHKQDRRAAAVALLTLPQAWRTS
jgi:hypothetical protein